MKSDQFARVIASSLARHQSRGLVDSASGMGDVVIHGRVDLMAVAEDLRSMANLECTKRSWGRWFVSRVLDRQSQIRCEHTREELAESLENNATVVDAAIARLRQRVGTEGESGSLTD